MGMRPYPSLLKTCWLSHVPEPSTLRCPWHGPSSCTRPLSSNACCVDNVTPCLGSALWLYHISLDWNITPLFLAVCSESFDKTIMKNSKYSPDNELNFLCWGILIHIFFFFNGFRLDSEWWASSWCLHSRVSLDCDLTFPFPGSTLCLYPPSTGSISCP